MINLLSRYKSALSFCRTFEQIIVTGSQRSGTTIAAQMIANDLSLQFIDEEAVDYNDFEKLRVLIESQSKFVLQLPNLILRMDEVQDLLASRCVGVVVMRRPYQEVEASRKRINFKDKGPVGKELILDLISRSELVKSDLQNPEVLLSRHVSLMEFGQLYIQYYLAFLPRVTVLDYESLQGHPMWISKIDRLDFGPKTTTLDGPRLSQNNN